MVIPGRKEWPFEQANPVFRPRTVIYSEQPGPAGALNETCFRDSTTTRAIVAARWKIIGGVRVLGSFHAALMFVQIDIARTFAHAEHG